MPGHALSERLPRLWPAMGWLANLERFVPVSSLSHIDIHQHARLFVLGHFFGPLIGLSLSLYLAASGAPLDYHLAGCVVLMCLFWVYPYLLRASGRYRLLCFLSLQHLMLVILWASYCFGGFHSPILLWLSIVPPLAFLYLTPSYRLWLAIFGMTALDIAVFVACLFSFDEPAGPGPQVLSLLGLLSMLGASAYVAMMSASFGFVLTSRADLEHEVVQHRQTTAALREATAEVRRAGEAKAEFVARMSHELRAPLNAIIGYGQLLLEDAVANGEHAVVTDLESIAGAGQYLIGLIDDVLDYSRIEAGAVELHDSSVDVDTLLERLAGRIRPVADQRRNVLALLRPRGAGMIVTDAALVEKAVLCIARHCVQATSEGRIEIGAAPSRQGEAFIAIDIGDDGPPIPPARLATLFDPLEMHSDAGATKYGAHGIGLALAQRICSLLGGTIEVRSEKSSDSRFRILLPRGA